MSMEVGWWSKMIKIVSTWLLMTPYADKYSGSICTAYHFSKKWLTLEKSVCSLLIQKLCAIKAKEANIAA